MMLYLLGLVAWVMGWAAAGWWMRRRILVEGTRPMTAALLPPLEGKGNGGSVGQGAGIRMSARARVDARMVRRFFEQGVKNQKPKTTR